MKGVLEKARGSIVGGSRTQTVGSLCAYTYHTTSASPQRQGQNGGDERTRDVRQLVSQARRKRPEEAVRHGPEESRERHEERRARTLDEPKNKTEGGGKNGGGEPGQRPR